MTKDGIGARLLGVLAAGIGGGALALARFIHYLQTIDDVDVGFAEALGWWGTWLAGAGLLTAGLLGTLRGDDEDAMTAWTALLVGVLILVVMPAFPGFAFSVDMGGMFGP